MSPGKVSEKGFRAKVRIFVLQKRIQKIPSPGLASMVQWLSIDL